MRIYALVLFAAVLASNRMPARERQAPEPVARVPVCVTAGGPIQVLELAERIASEIYASIGTNVQWIQGHNCPADAIQISLTFSRPSSFRLAHEIGHILEGVAQHSPAGLMKAEWSDEDHYSMQRQSLVFADADVSLIRAGLARREAHLVARR